LKSIVKMAGHIYEKILYHLFKLDNFDEQAVFAYGNSNCSNNEITIDIFDIYLVKPNDYEHQSSQHLSLKDDVLQNIIEVAHNKNASIIEMHSHRFSGSDPAYFSYSDFIGMKNIVPQLLWRLPNRPYIAFVFASNSFDALIWHKKNEKPRSIDQLVVEENILLPTRLSLEKNTYE